MMTPNESNNAGQAVIEGSIAAFRSNKGWADKAIAQLSDEKVHVALDANTNNIAVIMKHVAGNLLSRWTDFLTTDGEKPWRNRDDEFVDTFNDRDELIAYWESGWKTPFDSLSDLSCGDLGKSVTIRGELHSVPLATPENPDRTDQTGHPVNLSIADHNVISGDLSEEDTFPCGIAA